MELPLVSRTFFSLEVCEPSNRAARSWGNSLSCRPNYGKEVKARVTYNDLVRHAYPIQLAPTRV